MMTEVTEGDFEKFRVPRKLLYPPNFRTKENLPRIKVDDIQPKILDWYTVSRDIKDGTDVFRGHDKTLLRYLRMPSDPSNVNFDLNIEENEEEETDPSFDASSQLNHVLKWIMSYVERNGNQILQFTDFICRKIDLKAIMSLIYYYAHSQKEVFGLPFYFNAIKIGQMVFILRIDDKAYNELLRAHATIEMKQGRNLEKYLYAEKWDGEVRPRNSFKNNREVLRLTHHVTLHRHRILYVSNHKGLDGHPDVLDNFRKTGHIPTYLLRTRKELLPNEDHKWQVLMKWWQICTLIKADKVIVGHRQGQDMSGIVQRIEIISSNDLLKRTSKVYGEWKKEVQHRHGLEVEETPIKQEKKSSKVGTGIFAKNWRTGEAMTQQAPAAEDEYEKYESLITDISFGFLVQFLDHVKATLPQGVGEGPHVVYEFTWHPEENEVVSCQKLTGEKGVAASFIPDWFTQWLDSQHTST